MAANRAPQRRLLSNLTRRSSMVTLPTSTKTEKKVIEISPLLNAFGSAQAPPGLRLDAEDYHDGQQYVSASILMIRFSDKCVLAVSTLKF